MLREAGVDNCARRIDVARAAVLAGDIDDIPQHVAWEQSATG
jgi:hypothetical protein